MMLRITEAQGSSAARVLCLEGSICEQTASELDAACAPGVERATPLVLELGGVRFVDAVGATLLRELRRRGWELPGASPFVLAMIERDPTGEAGSSDSQGAAAAPDVARAADRQDASGPDSVSAEEADLLRELRAGSHAAFERLVRKSSGPLLAVARRLLPNEEDARDAVQEGFLSAFKALPSFAGDAKLSTWLHRIVLNAALMKLRSRRRRPEESIDDLLPCFDETGEWVSPTTAWAAPTESEVESRETRMMVRRSIDRLPETFRTVLLLRDIEDLDTEETAVILGVTPNAVKIRLHRARQALRSLLEREMSHRPDRDGRDDSAQPIG
jgi:RNA polymerase sigma-70 factor, ECF subfamily